MIKLDTCCGQSTNLIVLVGPNAIDELSLV